MLTDFETKKSCTKKTKSFYQNALKTFLKLQENAKHIFNSFIITKRVTKYTGKNVKKVFKKAGKN